MNWEGKRKSIFPIRKKSESADCTYRKARHPCIYRKNTILLQRKLRIKTWSRHVLYIYLYCVLWGNGKSRTYNSIGIVQSKAPLFEYRRPQYDGQKSTLSRYTGFFLYLSSIYRDFLMICEDSTAQLDYQKGFSSSFYILCSHKKERLRIVLSIVGDREKAISIVQSGWVDHRPL